MHRPIAGQNGRERQAVKEHLEENIFPGKIRENLEALGAVPGDSYLVALSGGADSTALLLAMLTGNGPVGKLSAAHVDHGARPGSDRDLDRVRRLCRDLRVPLIYGRLDPGELEAGRRRYGSLEAGMRKLRYAFLQEAALKEGFQWILTGHTGDDQAETVLFRAVRGMNWRSLAGIPGKRDRILRPLLDATHRETRDFCRQQGIQFLEDPSNRDESYARNRIRNTVLPLLRQKLHGELQGLLLRLGHAAGRLRDQEARLLGSLTREGKGGQPGVLDRALILRLPEVLQERKILDDLFGNMPGYPSRSLLKDVVRFVRRGGNGTLSLPGGAVLCQSYGRLRLLKGETVPKEPLPERPVMLAVPGTVYFRETGVRLTVRRCRGEEPDAVAGGNIALFCAQSLKEPLWVRRRLPGDRFRPIGMAGHRKVKELLVDRKVPREIRDTVPIVLDSEGDILWVAGVEVSGKAALRGRSKGEAVLMTVAFL